MGHLQAAAYAEFAPEFGLETVLTAHLRSNHYPPLPYEFVAVAVEALALVQDAEPYDGDFLNPGALEAPIEWPDAIMRPSHSWEDEEGRIFSTVATAIGALNLYGFIEFAGPDEEE